MKKFTALLLTFVLFLSLCPVSGLAEEAGKIRVVTTIFPIYDWVREIAGDTGNTEITLLLDSGVDLHSFQPSAQDILKVATCDLFIYVGGESDEWAEDALAEAVNPDMVVISLVEALGENAKAEEIVEGMQAEEEEEEGEEGEEEEEEIDEHVWLSLRNAQVFTSAIADALAQKDPANADSYRANAEAYGAKLAALDAAYAEAVDSAAHKTLLFGDRFPFRYLTDDYGLAYYAAFAGCSAETEASFETVIFLAKKTDELQLPAVLTIEGKDHRIAETIISSTADKNRKLLTLNSMQGTTANDIEQGATYLKIMEDNLAVLKEALN
jgi:zinc transport system substrate-binding protein